MFDRTPKKPIIPPPEDLNPRIAEIRSKISEFLRERTAAVTEEQEWAKKARENDSGRLQRDRVAELLGNSPVSITAPREERRRELKLMISDIDHAVQTLENALASERGRANALAADRAMPAYRDAIKSLDATLQAVRDAYEKADDIGDGLEALGFSAARMRVHASSILRGCEHSDVAILQGEIREWLQQD